MSNISKKFTHCLVDLQYLATYCHNIMTTYSVIAKCNQGFSWLSVGLCGETMHSNTRDL